MSELQCDSIGEAIALIGEGEETATSRSYLSTLWSYLHDVMRAVSASISQLSWKTLISASTTPPPISAIADALQRLSVVARDAPAELVARVIDNVVTFYDWLVGAMKIDESKTVEEEESAVRSISAGKSEISALRRILQSASVMAARVVQFMTQTLLSAFQTLNAAMGTAAQAVASFVGKLVQYGTSFVDTGSAAYLRINQFVVFLQHFYRIVAQFIGSAVLDVTELLTTLASYLSVFIDDIVRPVIVRRALSSMDPSAALAWVAGTDLFQAVYPLVKDLARVGDVVGWLWALVQNPLSLTFPLMSAVLSGLMDGMGALFQVFMDRSFGKLAPLVMAPTDQDLLGAASALLDPESPFPLRAAVRRDIERKTERFKTLLLKTALTINERADKEGGLVKVASNMLRGAWKASKLFAGIQRVERLDPTQEDDMFVLQHLYGIDRSTAIELGTARETLHRFVGRALREATSDSGGDVSVSLIGADVALIGAGPDDPPASGGSSTEDVIARAQKAIEAREEKRRREEQQQLVVRNSEESKFPKDRQQTTRILQSTVSSNVLRQVEANPDIGMIVFERGGNKYVSLPPSGSTVTIPPDVRVLDPSRPEDRALLDNLRGSINRRVGELDELFPVTSVQNKAIRFALHSAGSVLTSTILVERGAWTASVFNYSSWLISFALFGALAYSYMNPKSLAEMWGFGPAGFTGSIATVTALNPNGELAGLTFLALSNDEIYKELTSSSDVDQRLMRSWARISGRDVSAFALWDYWARAADYSTVANGAGSIAAVLERKYKIKSHSELMQAKVFTAAAESILGSLLFKAKTISYSVDTELARADLASLRQTTADSAASWGTWFASWVTSTTSVATGGIDAGRVAGFFMDVLLPGAVAMQVIHLLMDIMLVAYLARKKSNGTATEQDLQTLATLTPGQLGKRAGQRLLSTAALLGAATQLRLETFRLLMGFGAGVASSPIGQVVLGSVSAFIPSVGTLVPAAAGQ